MKPGLALLGLSALLAACDAGPWNSPYPQGVAGKTLYGTFSERPNHLDPARSYASNEWAILGQVYEPPLQYHYTARPYVLETLAAREMPTVVLLNQAMQLVTADAPVRFSRYTVNIKRGLRYQPHPAFNLFAETGLGELPDVVGGSTLQEFGPTASREVVAADFVHQIKRLAHPQLHSPIFGLLSEHILGLAELREEIQQRLDSGRGFVDLQRIELAGARVIDRYSYEITLKGHYPQFLFWLATPFFSPVPPEADAFYALPGLAEKNLTLDWYPVGAGPYLLVENNPNRRLLLARNPNYANVVEPAIERAIYLLEKESIPAWSKFLQGYYDRSSVSSDSFDQAIAVGAGGELALTDEMVAQGIEISTAADPTTFYLGFNMLDEVVGGESERARLLRQAISIAIDFEEYVAIFLNGRGIPAQGPLPPGIFGYREGESGVNPVTYRWQNGAAHRRSLAEAKQRLADAGYPEGVARDTGKPLVLYFDFPAGAAGEKARLDWFRKQFRKLNIQLEVRATTYNRFQEKIRRGDVQIFFFGWHADYPDPENFLFLLLGANGKVAHGGENASNYKNAEFDDLFARMRLLPNGAERQVVIARMLAIVREDAPWIWGFHPVSVSLHHGWLEHVNANRMANNTLKYLDIDVVAREQLRSRWNRPLLWPLALLVLVLCGVIVAGFLRMRRLNRATGYGS